MSVLVTYTVADLVQTTEKLMNTLYKSEWKSEVHNMAEDYLFNQIKSMHVKIMTDSEITTYEKGSSTLFDITNRLYSIESTLIGSAEPIGNVATVRTCILRTKRLIKNLSSSEGRFCVIS